MRPGGTTPLSLPWVAKQTRAGTALEAVEAGNLNRRAIACIALAVLFLSTVPPTAPAEHLLPCQPAENQAEKSADGARVLMGPEAKRLGFLPECVSVSSGGTITFASLDTTLHPVGTELDGGDCYSHTYQPGETGQIQIAYEDGTIYINGEPCPGIASETTEDYAVVEFECFIHPLMQLEIVVSAAGL